MSMKVKVGGVWKETVHNEGEGKSPVPSNKTDKDLTICENCQSICHTGCGNKCTRMCNHVCGRVAYYT